MALRFDNPFASPPAHLKPETNPYLGILREASLSGDLPIKFGDSLKGMGGKWREAFSEDIKSLVLEVGCHLGKTICEFAHDYPETGFIGADITFKRVCKTAMRAQEQSLKNIYALLFNGKYINSVFNKNELDGAVIFFPDPWVKERRSKNRLVTEDFAKSLKDVIKPGGFLWFKTDQKNYFDDAVKKFLDADFIEVKGVPLTKREYTSTFERKFKIAGVPTYEKIFLKKQPSLS